MEIDVTSLPELTRRQEQILSLIVRTYTNQPEPVSSKFLVDTFNLPFSSATIRNEMAVLEELGYISAPHTSAGRVPTENGYRYFVKRLINAEEMNELTVVDQTRISEKLQSLPLATEQWLRVVASVLARTSNTAALVTPPVAETSRFKHVELIAIQGRMVLMVLVLQEGAVYQQMLALAEPVPQPRLSDVAARLNNMLADQSASEVRVRAVHFQQLEREIIELIVDLMEKAAINHVRLVYREGLSEVISAFQNSEGAQQAVRVFEERAFLNMIFGEILTPIINNVQVVIAGNGRWEELSRLSMVLSRYGIPGQITGAVGVVGPTHINYGRAISAVGYVSTLMTEMLSSAYSDDKPALAPRLEAPDEPDESEG